MSREEWEDAMSSSSVPEREMMTRPVGKSSRVLTV